MPPTTTPTWPAGALARSANQPPPLEDYNVFECDAVLSEAVSREVAAQAGPAAAGSHPGLAALSALGALAGSPEAIRWGFQANANRPELRAFDRFGERIDEVEFHPAWHKLLEVAVAGGMHGTPWAEPAPAVHVLRAASFFVWSQVDGGVGCPVSMTYAAVPTLRAEPALAAAWEPLLTSRAYDPGLRPAAGKAGALCGMAMTERQGGSDVRANTTSATPVGGGGRGGEYVLDGNKWFCSAPMCDAFLTLAQAPGGLSCFLLPRVLDDGSHNGFHIERLKDKLGNRSNASSEIELSAAIAYLVGEEGRGIPTIVEMVNYTRLDCILGSAAAMRLAVAEAVHHSAHRIAFGRLLVEQPLMLNVLADLALESEAATALAIRLAGCCDRMDADPTEAMLKRIGTALGKFHVCKRSATAIAEALECTGGNGFIEESVLARLYRDAPLNSIWEGSGNVNALDVLRAMRRTPETVEALFAELDDARGADARYDAHLARLRRELVLADDQESQARALVEQMALALEGSLMVRHSPPAVADAFCASRLAGEGGTCFGTLPAGVDTAAIVERARPASPAG